MFKPSDRKKCEELFEKYYAGRKFYDKLYRDRIREHLLPGQWLLDAGCGRYMTYCKEFAVEAQVVGIDLESTLETDNGQNPYGVRGDLGQLPFPENCFDVVISRSVIEHLENPTRVFREFQRVLRPGGKVVIVTPNKYDYVSIVATLTPYRVHRRLAAKIFQITEDDVYPTLYRANTISALRKIFRSVGMVETAMQTINHYPAYLMFSPILFRVGVLYERITSLRIFRSLRGSILCEFEKPRQLLPEGQGHALQADRAEVA
jgi:ubiquinone/menaquinone biosynthesis C-methylase UbiE